MILAAPIEQFRSDYQIITPAGYTSNWLTVARLAGEPITLDGMLINDNQFRAFGGGQFELAWIEVNEGFTIWKANNRFLSVCMDTLKPFRMATLGDSIFVQMICHEFLNSVSPTMEVRGRITIWIPSSLVHFEPFLVNVRLFFRWAFISHQPEQLNSS